MYRLHISRSYISMVMILMFLASCSEGAKNIPPTSTAIPPTMAVTESSPMPDTHMGIGTIGLGDSLYPYFGNGGYDVQHYTLDLTVNDVATSDFIGITAIEGTATQDLSAFNLDFIGFEITSILVNGQPANFKRFRQELTITPTPPLVAGESFTVEIQYHGSPDKFRSVAIPFQTGWVTFDKGSYVMSEPDGAASFFPVNDHPLDKALYSFRVTVPKPFEVAANGVLSGTIDTDNQTTFLFEMNDPMASYLTTVDIGEFDLETSQAGNGVPIRNYYSTGVSEDIRKPFELQDEMLVFFSDTFGPYPFDVYGVLVMDTELGGALENQTMSVFGFTDANDWDNLQLGIAHELAHQWFGDSVSVADWRDIWLNESFATYAEGLWLEHTDGREALDEWVKALYAQVLENRQYMSAPGEPAANSLFNGGVYSWGALGLHALRLEVGDQEFFEILKTYYKRFEGGNVTTADFIAVAEEVSGKELSPFFDSWLYSRDLAPIPALGLEAKQ